MSSPTEAEPTTLAVVLAAGAGSRFEGPNHKLVTQFRGRPLVTHAVDTAIDACTEGAMAGPLVVTGAVDLSLMLEVEAKGPVVLAHNPDWVEGQATSLQLARRLAEEIGVEAMVVALGDQPLLTVADWLAVAGAEGAVATGEFEGLRRPPVRLHRSVWPLLPESGDEGARVLMRGGAVEVEAVTCGGNPVDIDSLKDLELWN